MTLAEKIELAEGEFKLAENMIRMLRRDIAKWEMRADLRLESLEHLKAQLKSPTKR